MLLFKDPSSDQHSLEISWYHMHSLVQEREDVQKRVKKLSEQELRSGLRLMPGTWVTDLQFNVLRVTAIIIFFKVTDPYNPYLSLQPSLSHLSHRRCLPWHERERCVLGRGRYPVWVASDRNPKPQ
jgi:hypothetical protein